jgi:hypothetical protein
LKGARRENKPPIGLSSPIKKEIVVNRRMKTLILLAVTLSLVLPGVSARAQTAVSPLEHLPYSTSLLVARAIKAGRIHPGQRAAYRSAAPDLTCSPATCVFANVDASEDGSSPANDTPIAVNPLHPGILLAGANDYSCTYLAAVAMYMSDNGGSTWTRTCQTVATGGEGLGDPGVGFDLQNNAYATGVQLNSSGVYSIVIEKSSDNGLQWSSPQVAVPALFEGGITDKDWLQIDTNAGSEFVNALYISVTQFDTSKDTQITVSHSTDGGTTFTMVPVSSMALYPNINQFSDMAIGSNGTVNLTWMNCTANGPNDDCGGTTAAFMLSTSTDGGNTWSTPKAILTAKLAPDSNGCCFYGALPNTNERISNIPSIAIDNSGGAHNGNLYVAYYSWSGTFMRVALATSTNAGSTWRSVPVASTSVTTHDQFFPWVSVDSKGLVGISWLDRRNDPANVNYEAFAAYSSNGGTTISANVDLSTAPSDPNHDGFGGFFIGDYIGNVFSSTNRFYVTFTDTTTGVDQDFLGGEFF